MEKTVVIIKQFPLSERPYTDQDGHPRVFASRAFVLSDGIDTFYAEATGDYARKMSSPMDTQQAHALQATIAVREYRDKDGVVHYSNEVKINKLV